MSAGNDGLLARWSRRKRAVRSSELQAPHKETQADDAAAVHADAVSHEQDAATRPEATETDALEPADLPRIEDLTAESDLSVFLRKGVPEALKSAAIRKMWSLDPGIRDYVGPAEYAWDFNQPGSMPGFGSLKPGEAIVNFLSKVGRDMPTEAEETAAAPESQPQPADGASEQQASATPDGAADDPASAESPGMQPLPVSLPSSAPDQIGRSAGHPETAEPAQSPRIAARPRHGGAMPR
jgi:hypothetical protein